MKIVVLGVGHIGSAIGRLWHSAGHETMFAGREKREPRDLAVELGARAQAAGAPGYFRMLTARATIRATVTMETADCKVMASLAQRDSGITSVGLNAAALVKAR